MLQWLGSSRLARKRSRRSQKAIILRLLLGTTVIRAVASVRRFVYLPSRRSGPTVAILSIIDIVICTFSALWLRSGLESPREVLWKSGCCKQRFWKKANLRIREQVRRMKQVNRARWNHPARSGQCSICLPSVLPSVSKSMNIGWSLVWDMGFGWKQILVLYPRSCGLRLCWENGGKKGGRQADKEQAIRASQCIPKKEENSTEYF